MSNIVISTFTLPSGDIIEFKDAAARQAMSGAITVKGTTTSALTDLATTNPIVINSENYTASANDAVFYGNKEFVFDGTNWHEFGDMSAAVASNQGVSNAGKFLVVNSSGVVEAVSMSVWQGGSY